MLLSRIRFSESPVRADHTNQERRKIEDLEVLLKILLKDRIDSFQAYKRCLTLFKNARYTQSRKLAAENGKGIIKTLDELPILTRADFETTEK